jgi:hypothetical protein
MRRRVASLLAVIGSFASGPALAEDTSPRVELLDPTPRQVAPPLSYGFPRPQGLLEPRSREAVTWGIVLVATGITSMILGTQLALAANGDCSFSTGPFGGPSRQIVECVDKAGQIGGMSILIGGALFTGGGIGVWLYGAEQVPKRSRDASARPIVVVGSGAAAVRWSF